MKNVADWVFNYNTFNRQWQAAKRENYKDLFNNYRSPNVLRSSEMKTLVSLIEKTNGDHTKINKLISG